jgi:hypothetical protein
VAAESESDEARIIAANAMRALIMAGLQINSRNNDTAARGAGAQSSTHRY